MLLHYDPLILPFVGSAAITAALAAYAARRSVPGAREFALLMAAITLWTTCYVMEMSSVTLEGKQLWVKLKYLGSAPGPAIWLAFALRATHRELWWGRPALALSAGWIAATWVVVFTPALQTLMWTHVAVLPGYPETQSVHGPYFLVYAAGSYALILAPAILFFAHYRATPGYFRRQALLLTLGGVVPLLGRMTQDFLGWDLIPRLDEVIFFFLVSGILFAVALFRYGALDIVPVAHDLVVRDIRAGIVVLDALGRVVELNPYAQELLGTAAREAIARSVEEVLAGWPGMDALGDREITISRDGEEAHLFVQTSPIRRRGGEDEGRVMVFFDVTARARAERQLAVMAATDPLTGVTNRRRFFELAQAELERAVRYRRPLTVMMLDVDHFKAVNDRYGHAAGDRVLRTVAAECARTLRATDVFARYGGEEFVTVLVEGTPEGAQAIAERVRRMVEEARVDGDDGATLRVTVSVGLAHLEAGEAATLDELIREADRALYAAKEAGRNRVTVAA
jgi:diguanylate cyclase (GGDEF)-like protein